MVAIDQERLDNPIWYSLTEGHHRLAIGDGLARRYPPDMAPFAALADGSATAWHDLAAIVPPGDAVALLDPLPSPDMSDWRLLRQFELTQMVCTQVPVALDETAPLTALTAQDVPAMLALVELTHPGPFLARTIELGNYLAIRQQGQIVAMAGERFCLAGYTEISAVCTHPDYQGRGYARWLIEHLVADNMHKKQIPFLHVVPSNPARRLYEWLDFRERKVFTLSVVQRALTR